MSFSAQKLEASTQGEQSTRRKVSRAALLEDYGSISPRADAVNIETWGAPPLWSKLGEVGDSAVRIDRHSRFAQYLLCVLNGSLMTFSMEFDASGHPSMSSDRE